MSSKTNVALTAGLIGSASLTALHEIVRRVVPAAPRMDWLGMNALATLIRRSGNRPPDSQKLYRWTMAGDLVGNAAYYSLVGVGKPKHAWVRGAALGLAAGLGAVALPRPLGLDPAPSNRTQATQLLAVALYTAGGLAAATAVHWLRRETKMRKRKNRNPAQKDKD